MEVLEGLRVSQSQQRPLSRKINKRINFHPVISLLNQMSHQKWNNALVRAAHLAHSSISSATSTISTQYNKNTGKITDKTWHLNYLTPSIGNEINPNHRFCLQGGKAYDVTRSKKNGAESSSAFWTGPRRRRAFDVLIPIPHVGIALAAKLWPN